MVRSCSRKAAVVVGALIVAGVAAGSEKCGWCGAANFHWHYETLVAGLVRM